MRMASRLEVRVEVRDCAKFVKVVIEKINVERIMRTEIQDRFVIKSRDGEIQKFSYWTFTVLLGVLLTCYKARVTSVEYNKVLMFSHSRSLEAFRVLRISAHIRAIPT